MHTREDGSPRWAVSYCVTVMAQIKLIAEMTANESSLGREERPDGTYPSSTLDTRACFH